MSTNTYEKKCKKCGQVKPITEFHKHKSSKDGIRHKCKACVNQESKEYREKNKERVKAYNKEYRLQNRDYLIEKHKQYRADNAEYVKKYDQEYKERNRERIRQYIREHYHNNKEYYRNKSSAYHQTERGKKVRAAIRQRRRARLTSLKNDLTAEQWEKILEMFNHECSYCGSKESLTQDHIIPLSKGGGTTMGNIIPACISCNSSKRDSYLDAWYKKKPFFDADRLEKIYDYMEEWEGFLSPSSMVSG